nr:hypothetical protein [Comamonas testosteroni]
MHTYCITVTQCAGRKPSVVILDFLNMTDAFSYASQKWPRASSIHIKTIQSCKKEPT